MNFAKLLFSFLPISLVFSEFRLIQERDNTVSLFCQLLTQKGSFKSIVPHIAWSGSQTFEFIDIRDQLNDSRYFGSHFPDSAAKNLIGIVVIRDFRDSDLQNNFKCSQNLFNGTLLEYQLTTVRISLESDISQDNPANTCDTLLILFIISLFINVVLFFSIFCKDFVVNFIKTGLNILRNLFQNKQTNRDPSITLPTFTPLSNSPLNVPPQDPLMGSNEEQDYKEPILVQRSLSRENALKTSDGSN